MLTALLLLGVGCRGGSETEPRVRTLGDIESELCGLHEPVTCTEDIVEMCSPDGVERTVVPSSCWCTIDEERERPCLCGIDVEVLRRSGWVSCPSKE